MSVSSMTNLAIARRSDDLGTATVPRTALQVTAATGGTADTENTITAALKSVATYIPTEVIALYLAVIAAVRSGATSEGARSTAAALRTGVPFKVSDAQVNTVIVFAIVTPAVVWMVYAGKAKTGGKKLPILPWKWPLWEMFAATVGFGAWAFSLPDSPFSRFSWYTLSWAAVVVLAVSTGLGLLAPVVQRKLRT
jgi:hypothetical protein